MQKQDEKRQFLWKSLEKVLLYTVIQLWVDKWVLRRKRSIYDWMKALFSVVKYLSTFCIWIFSTMKDPNIGQRGLRLKLWYWSSGFWRIIQHRGKSCKVYLAVATGQFWNACTQFEIAQNQTIQMKSISLLLCI